LTGTINLMQPNLYTPTDFRNAWLSKLGQRIQIPDLAFDDGGLCQLSFDGQLTVTIYKPVDTENLLLFGQLPVNNLRAELMQQMLTENRNHCKNTSAVLSLSENLNTIEVHFKLTQPELDATEDIMEQLITNLEYWRTHLTGY